MASAPQLKIAAKLLGKAEATFMKEGARADLTDHFVLKSSDAGGARSQTLI